MNERRKANQNDLVDLQAEYAQKRKRLVQEKEQEIENLSEHYEGRKEDVNRQGEAVINHIRNRIASENERASELRDKLNEKQNTKLRSMEEKYKNVLTESQLKRQSQVDQIRQEARDKVLKIEENTQAKIDEVRGKSELELQKTKSHYNKELENYRNYSERKVDEVRHGNKIAVERELEKGRSQELKLREKNTSDYTKLQQETNQKIQSEKEKSDRNLRRTEEEFAQDYDRKLKQWNNREERLHGDYSSKIEHNKDAYEKTLKSQHERFQSTYQKNEAAQRQSLILQKERLDTQLAEIKRDFLKRADTYNNKAEDPFYKVEDRGSYITETSDAYFLTAYIPEHEKDSVKVTVQQDKITVAGNRSFKDKIADESESKVISTNSYQNFREEFAVNKPIRTEGMTRERNGDWVIFTIPKLSDITFERKA